MITGCCAGIVCLAPSAEGHHMPRETVEQLRILAHVIGNLASDLCDVFEKAPAEVPREEDDEHSS